MRIMATCNYTIKRETFTHRHNVLKIMLIFFNPAKKSPNVFWLYIALTLLNAFTKTKEPESTQFDCKFNWPQFCLAIFCLHCKVENIPHGLEYESNYTTIPGLILKGYWYYLALWRLQKLVLILKNFNHFSRYTINYSLVGRVCCISFSFFMFPLTFFHTDFINRNFYYPAITYMDVLKNRL